MDGPDARWAGAEAGVDVFAVHGGNLAAARRLFKSAPEPWLDLSTGINPVPYPVPPMPATAWTRLPEADAVTALEAVAATAYGAQDPADVVAAPGTQALIQLLPRLRPARDVRILGFTYAEHARCWGDGGVPVTRVEDTGALVGADVAVVVNPNNPDGRTLTAARLADLAAALAGTGGLLVVDEAFCDVLPPGTSLVGRLPGNAIVLRSFGKTYGLAGLRLGFAVAGGGMASILRRALGPWAVSGPAIAVASAALSDRAWLATTTARLVADAGRLDALLASHGFAPLGGTPLFRFVGATDAATAFERLARRGVLVRRFEGWPGTLRFGLPSAGEWTVLADRLDDLVQGG